LDKEKKFWGKTLKASPEASGKKRVTPRKDLSSYECKVMQLRCCEEGPWEAMTDNRRLQQTLRSYEGEMYLVSCFKARQ